MRVLFVGNSHSYFNDMPALFARMCEELTGERPEVTLLAYSGRSLAWHREEYFALRFALLYGRYDYCVLQQQAHPFPGEPATEEALRQILPLCEKGGAKPVLYMTWPEKARPQNAAPMIDSYEALAERLGAALAPVGELFERFRGTDIELYWQDGEHASPYGSYLAALCFAALLCDTRRLDAVSDPTWTRERRPGSRPRWPRRGSEAPVFFPNFAGKNWIMFTKAGRRARMR